MPLLIATPKATDANSYLTVARADEILRPRLYASAWTDAAGTPSADDYVVNGAHAPGVTTVNIQTGTGTWTIGTILRFAEDSTEYSVTEALTGAGGLKISPALVGALAGGEAVTRLTPSTREASLIWASRMLDESMDWFGSVRTEEQAMLWPRSGVIGRNDYWLDYDTIPKDLEVATAELALALLGRDRFTQPELLGLGIEEASVGPLKVRVAKSGGEVAPIPDNILATITHLGTPKPSTLKGGRAVTNRRV